MILDIVRDDEAYGVIYQHCPHTARKGGRWFFPDHLNCSMVRLYCVGCLLDFKFGGRLVDWEADCKYSTRGVVNETNLS